MSFREFFPTVPCGRRSLTPGREPDGWGRISCFLQVGGVHPAKLSRRRREKFALRKKAFVSKSFLRVFSGFLLKIIANSGKMCYTSCAVKINEKENARSGRRKLLPKHERGNFKCTSMYTFFPRATAPCASSSAVRAQTLPK